MARSLKRLRMDVLPVCLFHKETDSHYLDLLHDLKEKGLIRHVGVTCIITGVESPDQIRQNIAQFSKGPLEANLVAAVVQVVPALPERVVSPFLWSKGVKPCHRSG